MMYALQINLFVNLLQEFNFQLVKDIRDYDNIALKSDAETKKSTGNNFIIKSL